MRNVVTNPPIESRVRTSSRRALRNLWALAFIALAQCATVDRSRVVVDRMRIHGTHHVPVATVRDRLATHESPRIPILGVRSPFSPPGYYDELTFRQDLLRVVRIYEAQGYYDATVPSSNVRSTNSGREVQIDVTVREGDPTRVASVQIPGCDPPVGSEAPTWRVPDDVCHQLRSHLNLRTGRVFTESGFHADQSMILDRVRESGRAIARLNPTATVDPARHEAAVVYAIDAGPPARFGTTALVEGQGPALTSGRLRQGDPVGPAIRAAGIRPGSRYSRTALADAQRRLFALNAFGVVRIEEVPHLCDSRNRCDALRDPSDPHQTARVDLLVHLSEARAMRLRFGAGAEADMLRSDVHLLARLEHRNFLGGLRHLRIEDRPMVFFPSVFGQSGQFDVGNALSIDLHQPAWRRASLLFSASWDFGPDPFNPGLTDRNRISTAVGIQQVFSHRLRGSSFVRLTRIDYYSSLLGGQSTAIDIDPLFKSQYRPATQAYAYLEQQITYDDRDNPLMPRRGGYLSALTQQGAPVFGQYAFLRGTLEGRGYLPLGAGFVIAARGLIGAIASLGTDVNGWPVPEELRFHSGGPNSNRGYPFNRVGPEAISPGVNCTINGSTVVYYDVRCRGGAGTSPYSLYVQDHNAVPDYARILSVGGSTIWEASVEMRWYRGPLGLVAFFDASDVGGWTAPVYNPNDPTLRRPDPITSTTAVAPSTPTLPGARTAFTFDPHPSAGLGVRYVTPIGVARLDIGMRLDDLGCSTFNNDIARENAATLGQPWYYVASRPRCDLFNLPIAINLALGEAY